MKPFPLILESIKDLSEGQIQDVFKLAKSFKNGSEPEGDLFSSNPPKTGKGPFRSKTPLIATFSKSHQLVQKTLLP